jgi:hypothetical protein
VLDRELQPLAIPATSTTGTVLHRITSTAMNPTTADTDMAAQYRRWMQMRAGFGDNSLVLRRKAD